MNSVTNPIVRLGQVALDILFPIESTGCGKAGGVLCSACEASLTRLATPYCRICGSPGAARSVCQDCSSLPLSIDGIRSPYLMQGPIREAIHGLKYKNLRPTTPALGNLLAQWMRTARIPGDVLVPVPLHRRRMRERGYNQSSLLAKEVSKSNNLPLKEDFLVRQRDTPPQVTMVGRLERSRNVEGSFEAVGNLSGLKVVLVDDVATTGSTLAACSKALKSSGAASVWGVVLAREQGRSSSDNV